MKDIESRLSAIVSTAEASVLELIAEAAIAGDYEAIDCARTMAERLRDINTGVASIQHVTEGAKPSRNRSTKKKRKVRPKKGEYPRYQVADGSLFKIGWSKKKSGQYTHRVPISAVKSISSALEQLSLTEEPVSSEQILESNALKEAGNPPSYQVYVVLAFLKERGVITSIGREGFRLPSNVASRVKELLRQEEGAS